MIKSSVKITVVAIKPGFEKVVADEAVMQASRDEPRRLVSTSVLGNDMLLVFELADQVQPTTVTTYTGTV